ncbi:FliH/SctL family protein [Herbaspirillum autotrophicum]|uniref:FliH/SctL family protein n=1 Tax=Herbaspirillum autotrophicum TaxID=180195 RepID=UPI0018DBE943|nr:FliH/SctL family protein [Herbaspirillum autotrophicum]
MHAQPRLLLRPVAARSRVAESVEMPVVVAPAADVEVNAYSLTELHEKARREGFDAGVQQGRESGLIEGREEGLRLGHEEGYLAGLKQGEQQASQDLVEAREVLHAREQQLLALLHSLPQQYARHLETAEADMVALTYEAVCHMLGEAFVSQAGASLAVRQALTQAAGRQSYSVRVHPDDFSLLQDDAALASLKGKGIGWEADQRVKLGGCLIDTPDGTLDARLEVQLQELASVLLKVRAECPVAPANKVLDASSSSETAI